MPEGWFAGRGLKNVSAIVLLGVPTAESQGLICWDKMGFLPCWGGTVALAVDCRCQYWVAIIWPHLIEHSGAKHWTFQAWIALVQFSAHNECGGCTRHGIFLLPQDLDTDKINACDDIFKTVVAMKFVTTIHFTFQAPLLAGVRLCSYAGCRQAHSLEVRQPHKKFSNNICSFSTERYYIHKLKALKQDFLNMVSKPA